MKEIKAYIKRHKLDEVTRALRKIDGLTGMSVLTVQGLGQGWHNQDADQNALLSRTPGVKLELFCRDGLVDQVVEVIEKAAHTGLRGDGKIYVSHIEQAIRVSTGERGENGI